MITTLILTAVGLILFIAPHHTPCEIFHRRRFYQHIDEMFRDSPPKAAMLVIVAIGLFVLLSPFYPALTSLAILFFPFAAIGILIASAIACTLAAICTPSSCDRRSWMARKMSSRLPKHS